MNIIASGAPMAGERRSELSAVLLGLAALLIGYALQLSDGHYNTDALRLVEYGGAALLLALVVRVRIPFRALEVVLAVGLMYQLYQLTATIPTVEMPGVRSMADLFNFILGLSVVGVLAGTGLGEDSPFRRVWFPGVVFVHFLMGCLILKLAPNPTIDVFTVEVESLKALFSGVNPYGITLPNPYGDNSPFIPPGVSIGGRLQFGFVYPPLTLLLLAPGWLLGSDPRYATLAGMTIAALLMGYARPGNVGKLAATVFLFTPRAFFVLDRAWTDPFVVMLTAAVAFAAIRKSKWLFVAIGLFSCLKQHMFIGLPAVFLLLPRPIDWRATWTLGWKSLAVGLGVTVPFVLLNPGAFFHSVIGIPEVYRLDALSLVSHWANTGVARLSTWTGLVAILPVIALGLWRAPRTATGFAMLVAAIHFTVYLFSTHAFCNEYYNVVGSLCVAAAVWKAPEVAAQPAAVPQLAASAAVPAVA